MPTHTKMIKTGVRFSHVTSPTIVKDFWIDVRKRLVARHRLSLSSAMKGIRIYRRRVGQVAMNRGAAETAAAISSNLKNGGFAPIHPPFRVTGKTNGIHA